MEPAARFHEAVPNVFTPQAQLVFHNATALDTANHVLNPHTDTGNGSVGCPLLWCQFSTARLFRGLVDRDARHGKALKAEILIQARTRWEVIGFLIRHCLIMPTAFIAGAQKHNLARVRNQQQIFDRMLFLLAAVVEPLFIGVGWSVDGAFRSIMEKKSRHRVQGVQEVLLR